MSALDNIALFFSSGVYDISTYIKKFFSRDLLRVLAGNGPWSPLMVANMT